MGYREEDEPRYRGIRIKFFMRKDECEVIAPDDFRWPSGYLKRRSIMAELIPEEEHSKYTKGDGRWYFHGNPP